MGNWVFTSVVGKKITHAKNSDINLGWLLAFQLWYLGWWVSFSLGPKFRFSRVLPLIGNGKLCCRRYIWCGFVPLDCFLIVRRRVSEPTRKKLLPSDVVLTPDRVLFWFVILPNTSRITLPYFFSPYYPYYPVFFSLSGILCSSIFLPVSLPLLILFSFFHLLLPLHLLHCFLASSSCYSFSFFLSFFLFFLVPHPLPLLIFLLSNVILVHFPSTSSPRLSFAIRVDPQFRNLVCNY